MDGWMYSRSCISPPNCFLGGGWGERGGWCYYLSNKGVVGGNGRREGVEKLAGEQEFGEGCNCQRCWIMCPSVVIVDCQAMVVTLDLLLFGCMLGEARHFHASPAVFFFFFRLD